MLSNHDIARLREASDARLAAQRTRELATLDPAFAEYAAERLGSGWLMYCGQESWWTEAVGLGMDGPMTDVELDALVGFFVSRRATPRVSVSSYAHPSLIRGLGARGFVIAEWEHVFVHTLDTGRDLWADWPHPRPEGVTLEVVDVADEAMARVHAEVATSGFREPGQPMTDDMFGMHMLLLRSPTSVGIIARVGGEVAGSAAMNTTDGIATLFGTSVLPASRRRGVQAALIVERLARARAGGARFACIHGKPGEATERNAQRLGFRMIYPRVTMVRPTGIASAP